jgi:hypothetical protein
LQQAGKQIKTRFDISLTNIITSTCTESFAHLVHIHEAFQLGCHFGNSFEYVISVDREATQRAIAIAIQNEQPLHSRVICTQRMMFFKNRYGGPYNHQFKLVSGWGLTRMSYNLELALVFQ